MKKFVIFFSTFVMAITLLVGLGKQQEGISFDLNSHVFIEETPQDLPKKQFDYSLNKYVKQHHSLVVKRIIIPQQSGETFAYQKFGQNNLPKALKPATKMEQDNSSILASYQLVSGPLTPRQLLLYFNRIGCSATIFARRSLLVVVVSSIMNSRLTLAFLVVFVLTFIALGIHSSIKSLHSIGVRLISGQSIWSIMRASTKLDALPITQAFLMAGIMGTGALALKGQIRVELLQTYWGSLLFYSCLLILAAVLLSLVYLLGLRTRELINVIRGKLAVKHLIGFLLFCQFLAMLIVGASINLIPRSSEFLKKAQKTTNEWAKLDDRVNLMTSWVPGKPSDWYRFQHEEIGQHDAIVVKSNIIGTYGNKVDTQNGFLKNNDPNGNTLYVTPNYLKREQIEVGAKNQAKLTHLKLGEFGLILPRKLKPDLKRYQEIYENMFAALTEKKVKPQPIISFVPDQKERFAYNETVISAPLVLTDPIIVVLTPDSTGINEQSFKFWQSTVVYSTFYRDYAQTKHLLKKHHLINSVADISNSWQNFKLKIQKLQQLRLAFILNAVIVVIASIFLFNEMHLLYFGECKRKILIKWLSGLKFMKLHFSYLKAELIILLLGLAVNYLITQNLQMSLVTLAIFTLNFWFSLIYRRIWYVITVTEEIAIVKEH